MKRIVKSQTKRKNLWWLIFLLPIIYVVVDNLIFPIDESALLKRTTVVEMREEAMTPSRELAEDDVRRESREEPSGEPKNGNGWETFDKIWLRVEKAWPLVMSLLAFFWRKKLVGDR